MIDLVLVLLIEASVRVPNKTLDDEKGYFEDRRPSSNMDPYLVSSLLFRSCILD